MGEGLVFLFGLTSPTCITGDSGTRQASVFEEVYILEITSIVEAEVFAAN